MAESVPAAVSAEAPRFEFLAGRLALDFCNTHARATGRDRLADDAALAAWAMRGGREFPRRPGAADVAALRRMRDRLCRVFDAVVDGTPPHQSDLDAILGAARLAGPAALAWDAAGGRAVPVAGPDGTARLQADIAADALSLLTGAAPGRVKRCPGETCGWFFFDTTRNGRRRWCAMADCGTRAKVRDYRARRRRIDATL